jgi:predicted lipoprotein with Yx(FWY)xxD motif
MTDRGAGDGGATVILGKVFRVLALVCAAGLVGLAAASATTSTTAVGSRNSGLGQIIIAGFNHHTLYGFSKDPPGKNKSTCYGKCSRTWIPFWAKGRVVAVRHSGVNARHLGKLRRRSGSWQVTYYGQPLYLFTGDKRSHQTKGHYKYQFGGTWYAIDVNGSPAPPRGYCLSVAARISTSTGSVPVADVKPGMSVWSTDLAGRRILVKILRVHHTAVSSSHRMVRLRLADGRHVLVSLGHPLPNGKPVATLVAGQQFEGTRVVSAARVRYGKPYTYDLLPAGPTHTYFADGVLLGSTLAPAPGSASTVVLTHPF